MVVYLHRINFAISNSVLATLKQQASPKRWQRAECFYHLADTVRCLMAEQLLNHALSQQGLPSGDKHIMQNRFGKPMFKASGFGYFNLSHSGRWLVCAVDKQMVGIDVEQCRTDIDFEIMNFFSHAEKNYINDGGRKNKLTRFYRIWTLKESYLKALGTGLSQPLDSFTVDIIDGHHACLKINKQTQTGWHFYYVNLDDSHVCAICARHPININDFKFCSKKSLLA